MTVEKRLKSKPDTRAAKPLKVLHVVGAMNRAGTETMLMNLYRNIDLETVQFDFISYSEGKAHYDSEIINMGARIITLRKTSSLLSLYQAMKRYGPYDVVHAHTLFHCGIAALAGKLAGVKVRIAHAHTTDDDSDTLIRKIYHNVMRRIVLLCSTDLLACSDGAARYLFGDDKSYTYFPNVIDYETFLEAPELEVKRFKKHTKLENNVVVGHIGRFIAAKNHAYIMTIIGHLRERNPGVKLLLVGDGDLRESVEETARQDNLLDHIRFTGVRNDVATLLHSMDVFIFPSVYEGLGLVLLEAQACGVPCVVSDAIQDEADLGLGLVSKLSLEAPPEVWADRILAAVNHPKPEPARIRHAFEQNGFAISKGISVLMKTYHSNEGDTDEQIIDRVL